MAFVCVCEHTEGHHLTSPEKSQTSKARTAGCLGHHLDPKYCQARQLTHCWEQKRSQLPGARSWQRSAQLCERCTASQTQSGKSPETFGKNYFYGHSLLLVGGETPTAEPGGNPPPIPWLSLENKSSTGSGPLQNTRYKITEL